MPAETNDGKPSQPARLFRARRKHVTVPVSLIESELSDAVVRFYLRCTVLEEIYGIEEWGDDDLTRLCGVSQHEAQAMVAALTDAGYLTLDPGPLAPAVLPPAPPEPGRFLEARWAGERGKFNRWSLPGKGEPVVYWLYDADDQLAYVGASGGFRDRIKGHDDKPWVRFEARLCNTRKGADDLELIEIRERKPYLNRTPGSLDAMARAGAR